MRKGKTFIVSGPSGVGKSTVINQVMKQYPNLKFSVSATTRPQRPTEVHGVNYYFMNREMFEQMILEEKLLEYTEYVGNYYGTPEQPVDQLLAEGYDILLDVEPVGALNVKRRRPDAVLIFMLAPSFSILEKRLSGRGDTAPELVRNRLDRARWEYTQANQYDYLVVNDDVNKAVGEICSIITAEKCKTKERNHYLLKED